MRNPAILVLHLFVLVLFYFSTSNAHGSSVYNTAYQEQEEAHVKSCLSISEATKVYAISHPNEQVTNPVNNRRTPPTKNHPNHLFSGSYFLELTIAHNTTQYLLHSRNINPGLSGSDIIFPFHYFW